MALKEFIPERDIALVAILVGAAVLGAVGVTTLVSYAPLFTLPKMTLIAAALAPLLICPIVHYCCWAKDKLRWSYVCAAVVFTLAASTVAFFRYNGALDTQPSTEITATVMSKHRLTGRAGHAYSLKVLFDGKGPFVKVSVGRDLWQATSPGDQVCVVTRPGRFGIPWRDDVKPIGDETSAGQ